MNTILSSGPADRPAGSRLVRHRWKAALVIAAVEGLIAAFERTSRWAVIAFALLVLFAYFRWGRAAHSSPGGQLAWIGAASQALVIVLAAAAFVAGLLVLVAVSALAAIALVLLLLERGR
ncbi:hypothetical protein Gocc_0654 [Gaiella occulta]|uniref:DUF2568 domain-containing protein n=1 Tax=Gaiella occulta TaxID=1002870 RepID=A0A7M2Z2D2_9ACTN|nr:hypothetical protein [Gaiella occulta]RDI76235.1 hypothetical protein Gocc_0654 [Gaiella occulta]